MRDKTCTNANPCGKRRFWGVCGHMAEDGAPQAEAPIPTLLDWAVGRWNAEVRNRPLQNVYRRILDDTWRQVIRFAGGDPKALVGPDHDTLVAVAKTWPKEGSDV